MEPIQSGYDAAYAGWQAEPAAFWEDAAAGLEWTKPWDSQRL